MELTLLVLHKNSMNLSINFSYTVPKIISHNSVCVKALFGIFHQNMLLTLVVSGKHLSRA